MNDNEMLAAMRSSLVGVKDSLSDVHMDRPASAITARARARRLRRTLSAAGTGGVALSAVLALALSGSHPASRSVHVSLDGFSVNTTANGTVDVTIGDLRDPALLRQVLAEAGIPAIINVGKVCIPDHGLPGIQQVVENQEKLTAGTFLVLNPAAMPAGAKLDFSVPAQSSSRPSGQGTRENPAQVTLWAAVGLVRDGTSLTCHPAIKVSISKTSARNAARLAATPR